MLKILLAVLGVFIGQICALDNKMPDTIEYDRAEMDAVPDDQIWQGLQKGEYKQTAGVVHYIDDEFYDEHLVSRWGSEWLDSDKTWVIGITKPEQWANNYNYPLVGKTIRILSKVYAHNDTMRFGLVNFETHEEIKECLVGKYEPKIAIIKNGKILTVPPLRESYN